METNRLKQFCLVVETGSLTAASRLLNVTHSSLSKSLKVLQQDLNENLLQPSGRGLTTTERGREIYKAAKEMLETENRLFNSKVKSEIASIRIGAPEVFLGGMIEAFKTKYFGDGPMTLLDLEPGVIENMIGNGGLDFGVTYAPYPSELVEVVEIAQYKLGCFHLEGKFNNVPLNELPFVVPAQGLSNNPLGIKERDGWVESLIPRNKMYSVNLLSTGIDLALGGACAIFIPKFLAYQINSAVRNSSKLVEYPTPPLMKKAMQSAYAIRSKGRHEDRNFRKFCAIIRRMIHAGPS